MALACVALPAALAVEAAETTLFLDGHHDYLTSTRGLVSASADFTVETWVRIERKERDDYEEACLVSHGSWEGRFKLSMLPSKKLRFTVNSGAFGVIDCDGTVPLRFMRWYHVAGVYDSTGSGRMTMYINGVEDTSCAATGPAAVSNAKLVVGKCYDNDEGIEYMRGSFADVRYFTAPRTVHGLREAMFDRQACAAAADTLACLGLSPSEHESERSLNYETPEFSLVGSPQAVPKDAGDQYLSVTLQVGEYTLTSAEACRDPKSSSWCALVPPSAMGRQAIVASLGRYFAVKEDEWQVWGDLGEMRERVEAMGHTLARTIAESPNPSPLVTLSESEVEEEDKKAEKLNVAMVVPATSKGARKGRDGKAEPTALPLYEALLRSLYQTCEPEFRYTVYLAVNEGDPFFGDPSQVRLLFDVAYSRLRRSDDTCGRIEHRVSTVPNAVVPSRALSALFNVPTLTAHRDGADYIYLANDDLLLETPGWTSAFVGALQSNPLLPNLGVAGAADTSDTVTPQIEFPFFHRTHVELFEWCGANPWVFRNWWEDNWLTDIYLPFQSVFYMHQVTVRNYGGLVAESSGKGDRGATDPRYKLSGGRRVPTYYIQEVEHARHRIHSALASWDLNGYPNGPVNEGRLPSSDSLDYCSDGSAAPPGSTLAAMPVAPHQDVLDPCHGPNTHGRAFELGVAASEVPHHPYTERLSDDSFYTPPRNHRGGTGGAGIAASAGVTAQARLDATPKLAWKGQGVDTPSATAAASGVVRPAAAGDDSCLAAPFSAPACKNEVGKLRILVLHHHVPLYDRYGCDKRLFHILESLKSLGHEIVYGGKHVSDFESAEDKLRLPRLGVRVVTPLAEGESLLSHKVERLLGAGRAAKHPFDVVIMTLWFWNTSPIPRDFAHEVRSKSPRSKVVLLSDDVHYLRLVNTGQLAEAAPVKAEELLFYRKADAVLTITAEDRSRILSAEANSGASIDPLELDPQRIMPLPMVSQAPAEAGALQRPFEQREGLVMVGNGANPVNRVSIEWFLSEVWPAVRAALGEVTFSLIGADWDLLGSLVTSTPGVEVMGFLEEEHMVAKLASCRVFVSPIVGSTGLNTKNVLALEHGLPLVTTALGADGLHVRAANEAHDSGFPIAVVDEPGEFAKAVAAVYQDRAVWEARSAAAPAHVATHFSRATQVRELEKIVCAVVSTGNR